MRRRVFAEFDADGSGTIDREELKRALHHLQISVKWADHVIDHFDTDGDGRVPRSEAAPRETKPHGRPSNVQPVETPCRDPITAPAHDARVIHPNPHCVADIVARVL